MRVDESVNPDTCKIYQIKNLYRTAKPYSHPPYISTLQIPGPEGPRGSEFRTGPSPSPQQITLSRDFLSSAANFASAQLLSLQVFDFFEFLLGDGGGYRMIRGSRTRHGDSLKTRKSGFFVINIS